MGMERGKKAFILEKFDILCGMEYYEWKKDCFFI